MRHTDLYPSNVLGSLGNSLRHFCMWQRMHGFSAWKTKAAFLASIFLAHTRRSNSFLRGSLLVHSLQRARRPSSVLLLRENASSFFTILHLKHCLVPVNKFWRRTSFFSARSLSKLATRSGIRQARQYEEYPSFALPLGTKASVGFVVPHIRQVFSSGGVITICSSFVWQDIGQWRDEYAQTRSCLLLFVSLVSWFVVERQCKFECA